MKLKAITLIREYFEASLNEIKALTSQDRQELGSAIARSMGKGQEDCEFELVAY